MAVVTPRRTKIVATIGPASATPELLAELARAGMDGARLNLSHGTHDEHRARFDEIRQVESETGRPIGILADLQGPKLRLGNFAGGRISSLPVARAAVCTSPTTAAKPGSRS